MIYENVQKLYLASASPRRQEMLALLGLEIERITPSGEDGAFPFKSPRYYVETKARQKMCGSLALHPDLEGCVITADTIVVRKSRIFEKPSSPEEAVQMLKALEGKWHSVYSAFCLRCCPGGDDIVESLRTQVKFKPLSLREIENYVATGEPLDKAGAYAVQGLGSFMIEAVQGSISNVIGLPLTQLTGRLLKTGIIRPRRQSAARE